MTRSETIWMSERPTFTAGEHSGVDLAIAPLELYADAYSNVVENRQHSSRALREVSFYHDRSED